VIDATGSGVQPNMTVLISQQHIAALGSSNSVSIPRGARIVDGTGKFLIPGLADMHIHLTGAGELDGSRKFIIPLLLANGITTVRDMGGYLESLVPLRKEIREGKRLGPDIVYAGPYLDGNPPSFQPSLVVNNASDADKNVRDLIDHGVDFIKVQSMLSRDAYFAIVAACKREDIAFVGHVPDRVTAAEASDAGQHSIEHLTGVLRACSKNERRLIHEEFLKMPKKTTAAQSRNRQLNWQREVLRTQSEKFTSALLEEFLHNHTWQVPTLITLRNVAFPAPDIDFTRDPHSENVPRHVLDGWRKERANELKISPPQFTSQQFAVNRELFRASIELVRKMNATGVRILAGTDSAAPFVFPGTSLHEELVLLVQAGLAPMQALQAATRSPAEFLGRLDQQGTVEQGKFADLLLLDANPLDDIHNTQKIHALILRGKLLDRNALDEILADEKKFAAN
jgi:imidazolonepropionase-like amidohydrolase